MKQRTAFLGTFSRTHQYPIISVELGKELDKTMQDTNTQEIATQEQDSQAAEADNIRYQVLLASEEAAFKLRNSVAGMSGNPLKAMGPGEKSQLQKADIKR
jgi:hypothetical protein